MADILQIFFKEYFWFAILFFIIFFIVIFSNRENI